ncbi:hypothetical protein IDJ75_18025 [Mucilaginibacter rigui]|uniref:Bacteriocin n=1 Tax=Mucilaginibacter rigui TaxID=534635 RepID=A0ABR7X9K2_9SPHI|nr:hypothetical protein [Mucilaginibacter rigui]MBD1387191.1 hypothetical protein [Mucilaginibacter rigui]
MSKFNKLSRAEMRDVLGGTYGGGPIEPGDGGGGEDCPDNECGGTLGTCAVGKSCYSKKCPKDANFYYNYCA